MRKKIPISFKHPRREEITVGMKRSFCPNHWRPKQDFTLSHHFTVLVLRSFLQRRKLVEDVSALMKTCRKPTAAVVRLECHR